MQGSLGAYNGSIVGGAALTGQLGNRYTLRAGDQTIGVGLPTNTEYSAEVLARGLDVTYSPNSRLHLGAFGGMGGGGYSGTTLQYFRPQIPLGALSLDYYLDPKRRVLVFGRALFSNRQTALGGLWFQSAHLQAGFAAGTGSNQPHVETILRFATKRWEVREAYDYSHRDFQLITLPEIQIAQEDGENIDVRWKPAQGAILTTSRHEYLDPIPLGLGSSGASSTGPGFLRGSMDAAGGAVTLHRQTFGANLYESRFGNSYGSASSLHGSQRLSKMLFVNEDYYWPLHSTNAVPMLVATAGETVNRRLTLNEFATHANGQWNINYGGGLHLDWLEMNVGYGTSFVPLAQSGGRFQQSMNIDGHLTIGRWQLGVNTYVQPSGQVVHAYEIKTFYLHSLSNRNVMAPASKAVVDVPEFLITGHVQLQGTETPVADVPIRVGDRTIYSDETGAFNVRMSHRRPTGIALVLDHPVDMHRYEQVSGPSEATPGPDADPGKADFVVRLSPDADLR